MKLNLYQIQLVDFILHRLNNQYSYTTKDLNLNLVVKINDSLWSGKFMIYNDSYVSRPYIDFDNCIESKTYNIYDLFSKAPNFNSRQYSNIKLDNIYLLLEDLINFVSDLDLSESKLPPILYNAYNLNAKVSLPFLYLSNDAIYEIVSISAFPINECIHS